MGLAVLSLLRCLRVTYSASSAADPLGPARNYRLRGAALHFDRRDYMKWSAGSFGEQLLIEIAAGISFALGVLNFRSGC